MKLAPCQFCNGTGKQLDQQFLAVELRALRVKSGLSLRQLAAKLGITPAYLCDLERGRRNWRTDRIDAFKAACRCKR